MTEIVVESTGSGAVDSVHHVEVWMVHVDAAVDDRDRHVDVPGRRMPLDPAKAERCARFGIRAARDDKNKHEDDRDRRSGMEVSPLAGHHSCIV